MISTFSTRKFWLEISDDLSRRSAWFEDQFPGWSSQDCATIYILTQIAGFFWANGKQPLPPA